MGLYRAERISDPTQHVEFEFADLGVQRFNGEACYVSRFVIGGEEVLSRLEVKRVRLDAAKARQTRDAAVASGYDINLGTVEEV